MFDSFEELVHELRDQLRTREILELTNQSQREFLRQRELELDALRAEIDTLKKQKDGLMKALGWDECVLKKYSRLSLIFTLFCMLLKEVRSKVSSSH